MGWPWDRVPKDIPSIPRFEKPARDIAVPIDDTDCEPIRPMVSKLTAGY
jgi:hypothetical protein